MQQHRYCALADLFKAGGAALPRSVAGLGRILADVARGLVKSGDADDDKAAVAYAAALPQNQKKT